MMERQTRAIGSMATAERKNQPTTTKTPDGQSRGQLDGLVQKGKPVGAMTTRNDPGLVPDEK